MKDFLLKYFRNSIIEGVGTGLYDPEFNLSDDELEDILKVSLQTINKDASLDNLNSEFVYPVILLGKREVYYRLATKNAPLYSVDTDTVKLSKQQRFDHYYSLIQAINGEYQTELSKGTFTYIQSGELLLDGKHYTSARQYALAKKPEVELKIDNIYTDSVEISWSKFDTSGNNKFFRYYVYINNNIIIDKYNIDNNFNYISYGTKTLEVIYDIHRTCFRVKDLQPNTTYHIAVVSQDINSLFGYSELEVTTLPVE